jgi:hypothetical protein
LILRVGIEGTAGAAPRTPPYFLLNAQKKVSKEKGVSPAVGIPFAIDYVADERRCSLPGQRFVERKQNPGLRLGDVPDRLFAVCGLV